MPVTDSTAATTPIAPVGSSSSSPTTARPSPTSTALRCARSRRRCLEHRPGARSAILQRIPPGAIRSAILIAILAVLLIAVSGCTTWVRGPDLAREYYNIGNAFYDLGRFDRAVDYYRRALALDRTLAAASFNLARVYADQGRFPDAIDVLLELIVRDPESVLLRETLAFVYFLQGDVERAETRYREVLALSPFHVNALYNLGRIERKRERYAESAEFFRRAVQAQPADAELLFAYADALNRVDPERSAPIFERYLDTSPTDRTRLLAAGDALRTGRFFSPARRAYRKVLDQRPDDAAGLFGMAVVFLVGIEESEAGLDFLERALDAGFTDNAELSLLVESVPSWDQAAVRRQLEQRGVMPSLEPPADPTSVEDAAGP
ncbi:MAG: tetratricopeptide repeat protein [Spirochaetaceae bacterium]|nr:MAG: tetratricopeptide repeat protein [Spirochaetaceae bacterium]